MIGSDARTIVFLGPSCPIPDARRAFEDAIYLPPASCGDILYALRLNPRRIAIIDGAFGDVPSIWHKEILFALSKNVEVWGAASMGALRASELSSFGMKGFGQVYQWFADEILTDDDEVAVLYVDIYGTFESIVDPMVNIRATIGAAVDVGIVSDRYAIEVIRDLKAIHFKERSLAVYLNRSNSAEARALNDWISAGNYVDIKRCDAIGLLHVLREVAPVNGDTLPVQLTLSLRRLLQRTATSALPFSDLPLPDGERALQLYAAEIFMPSLRRLALLLAFFDGWMRSQANGQSLDSLIDEFREAIRSGDDEACVDLLIGRIIASVRSPRRLVEPDADARHSFYESCRRLDGTYSSCISSDIDPVYHRILVLVSGLWCLFEGHLQASGLRPSTVSLAAAVGKFRRARGLLSEEQMRAWLRDNDLGPTDAHDLFVRDANFTYILEGCFFEQFGFLDITYDRNWLLYAAKAVAGQGMLNVG